MRLNKRAIALMETMTLIISIVFLVMILYFFISKGVAGPVKGSTSELACTFSTYSRGLLVESLTGFLNMFEATARTTFLAGGMVAGCVGGAAAGGLAGLGTGPMAVAAVPAGISVGCSAGGYAGGYAALEFGESIADSYSLQFLSSIPMVCPASTENIGLPGKTETSNVLASKLGAKLFDTWRAMGQGAYDPIVGLDPPNPRTIFIIETHLNAQTDFNELINLARQNHPNDWPFGDEAADNTRLYLYCTGRSAYKDCSIQDSRIYIMYKDDHNYDKWTAGTSVCNGNINVDAKEYKDRAQGVYNFQAIPLGGKEISYDILDYRTFWLNTGSPWYHERDALVVCVENIGVV